MLSIHKRRSAEIRSIESRGQATRFGVRSPPGRLHGRAGRDSIEPVSELVSQVVLSCAACLSDCRFTWFLEFRMVLRRVAVT
jgi:hypothetical protein